MRSFLAEKQDGKPGIQIFDCCENLIRTLPTLIFDAHNREDAADGEDHAPEALRYGLMSRPAPSILPKRKVNKGYDPLSGEEVKGVGFLSR